MAFGSNPTELQGLRQWDFAKRRTGLSMEGSGEKAVISVVVPVYNSQKTLEKTVDSILRQS